MRVATFLVPMMLVPLSACHKTASAESERPPASASAAPAPPPKPEPPKEPTTVERLAAQSSLAGALAVIGPHFTDATNDGDPASAAFALWAADHLTWEALQTLPETKHALIMKDPTAERGKRNCYTGVIIEIKVDRSAGPAIYTGEIMTGSSQMAHFMAVGSTGELVERSGARFCGVVTGLYSYSNSGGGTTHSVNLVGFFDLPQNKPAARQAG